ncbi:MAG: hypothetical protein LBL78_06240 [Prevotellaceae bacterium]|jgi:hypothetical protein|nr:hypothetical protein [Prevotellaceae bacterium]
MNKSKSFLFFAGFVGLMLAGCQAYDEEDQVIKSTNGLKVNYSSVPLKANNDTPNTRANDVLAVNGEDLVNTMRLFFFKTSDDGTGAFVESYTVPETELGGNSIGNFEILPPNGSNLILSDAYVILAVVNAPQDLYTSADATYAGMNETEFTTQIRFTVTGANDESAPQPDYQNHRPFNQSSLPMSCRIEKAAGSAPLNMTFERVMARIDVAMGDPNYAIMSASVWNAADAVTIWPTTATVPTNVISRLYGITPDSLGAPITGGLYALPHYVESPAQDDAATTCLILGIAAFGDSDGDLKPDTAGVTSYYRLNITNKDMQNLRRNKAYSVRIMGVRDIGATNEKDALTEAEQLLNITVNNWQLDDQGTVFQDEFGNMLAIGTSHLRIPPEGGRFNVQVYTIDVGVSNPRLRIRSSRLPTGMEVSLIGNVLEFTSDASEIERTGLVEIEYGTLIGTVQVTQTGLTDQYLEIDPADVPIFEGDAGLTAPRITVSSSGSWTAVLYNPGFTFIKGGVNQASSIDTLTGVDHDQVYIQTHSKNEAVLARSAFCLFTLDSNPEIRRTLVLTQRGVGGIDLKSNTNENISDLRFDQFAVQGNPNFAYFVVTTSNDGTFKDWEIVKSGTHADKFKSVSVADPTQEKTEGTHSDNTFTIVADSNRTETAYTATFRVQLKGNASVGRSFNVTQAGHSLTFNPSASAGNISLSGGSETFKVTSTTDWTATIETRNANVTPNALITDSASIATLNKYAGVTGDEIIVTFPPNTAPMIIPLATITVKLNNTDVVKTFTVRQAQLNPRSISILQHGSENIANGGLRLYDDAWAAYIRAYLNNMDPIPNTTNGVPQTTPIMNFGPNNCTVYTMAPLNIAFSSEGNPTFGANVGIYWDTAPYTAAWTSNARAWKNQNKANFYISAPWVYYYPYADDALNEMTAGGYSYVRVSVADQRTITPAGAYADCKAANRGMKLWDYLLNGPFGKVDATALSSVVSISAHGPYGNAGFNTIGATMVPIVTYQGSDNVNRTMVGIDPTYNVAIVNPMLWHRYLGWNEWTADSPQGIFWRNFLAFIVNSAQYGEDFTKQYR